MIIKDKILSVKNYILDLMDERAPIQKFRQPVYVENGDTLHFRENFRIRSWDSFEECDFIGVGFNDLVPRGKKHKLIHDEWLLEPINTIVESININVRTYRA